MPSHVMPNDRRAFWPPLAELRNAVRLVWEWLVRLDEIEAAHVFLEHVPYCFEDDYDVQELRRYTDVMRSHLATPESYRAFYTDIWEAEPPASREDIERVAFVPRFKWALEIMQQAGARTLLDLGPGEGGLCFAAALRGISSTGVNLTERAVHKANERRDQLGIHASQLQFVYAEAEQYRHEQPVDVVCAFEIIEHVKDPLALMTSIWENCHPGGRCFLSTPLGSVGMGYDMWFDRNYRITIPICHVRAFTVKRLQRLMEQCVAAGQAWTDIQILTCSDMTPEAIEHVARGIPVAALSRTPPLLLLTARRPG